MKLTNGMLRRFRNIVCSCLLALMLAECAYSHGQAEQGRAEALPEAKAPAAIRVPFRLLPNKMIAVQAELDSLRGWFIFDTGAPRTMVNRKYFHAVRRRDGYSRITDVSGVPLVERSTYPSHELNFHGIVEQGAEYVSIDMTQMAREDGLETLGMIGAGTLQGYDVLYDYADSTLTFIRTADTDAYLAAHFRPEQLHQVAASVVEHVPCVPAKIGDDVYQLAIDCGAGGSVLSQSYRRQLANHSRPIGAVELTGISRIPVRVTQIQVHRMEIGDCLFTSMDFLLHNLRQMGIEDDDGIDGMVGYDVLSRQKTLISVESKRVVFINATHL